MYLHLFIIDAGISSHHVGDWSPRDVQSWMEQEYNKDLFGPYKEVFLNEEVDGALLVALSADNLVEIGVDCATGTKMAERIALLTGSTSKEHSPYYQ